MESSEGIAAFIVAACLGNEFAVFITGEQRITIALSLAGLAFFVIAGI